MNNQEIYEKFKELDPILAEKFKSENIKPKKKIHKVWPRDLLWWNHKKFNPIKKKYKSLEPAIIEFGTKHYRLKSKEAHSIVTSNSSKEFYLKHHHLKNKDKKEYAIPALLKLNCKTIIAKKIGCSEISLKYYIAMFVRCRILRVDNFGGGKIYLSSGYWGDWRDEDKVWKLKVFPYLNKGNSNILLDPEFAYLRKRKK